MATVVPEEILTLHTKGYRYLVPKCTHFWERTSSQTGIRVRLRVCECAIIRMRGKSDSRNSFERTATFRSCFNAANTSVICSLVDFMTWSVCVSKSDWLHTETSLFIRKFFHILCGYGNRPCRCTHHRVYPFTPLLGRPGLRCGRWRRFLRCLYRFVH